MITEGGSGGFVISQTPFPVIPDHFEAIETIFSKSNSPPWKCYFCLYELWEAPNPPNMRYFQNLTCFSIFVIWTNPSSSECAKTIKKICRKQNFNLTLKFFEKKFLVASMSTFIRKSLLKSASELEKMKKSAHRGH